MLFAFSDKRNMEMMEKENTNLFPEGVKIKGVFNYPEDRTKESKICYRTLN